MTKKKNSGTYTVSDILAMKSQTDFKRLDAMTDEDIDYSDIPPLTEEFWKNVKLLKPSEKEMISLRVDKDIVDWFRKQGKGYQSYMNAVLKSFVESKRQTK